MMVSNPHLAGGFEDGERRAHHGSVQGLAPRTPSEMLATVFAVAVIALIFIVVPGSPS